MTTNLATYDDLRAAYVRSQLEVVRLRGVLQDAAGRAQLAATIYRTEPAATPAKVAAAFDLIASMIHEELGAVR